MTKPLGIDELQALTRELKKYFSGCAIMRMEPEVERVAEILTPYTVEPIGALPHECEDDLRAAFKAGYALGAARVQVEPLDASINRWLRARSRAEGDS